MPEAFLIDELHHRCMGNPQLVQRVLASFRLSFMNDLAQMEIHFLSGQLEKVAKTAHKIKGSAANAAAPAISELAQEVESLARQGNNDLDQQICNLQSEFTRFASAAFREDFRQSDDDSSTGKPTCA